MSYRVRRLSRRRGRARAARPGGSGLRPRRPQRRGPAARRRRGAALPDRPGRAPLGRRGGRMRARGAPQPRLAAAVRRRPRAAALLDRRARARAAARDRAGSGRRTDALGAAEGSRTCGCWRTTPAPSASTPRAGSLAAESRIRACCCSSRRGAIGRRAPESPRRAREAAIIGPGTGSRCPGAAVAGDRPSWDNGRIRNERGARWPTTRRFTVRSSGS